MGLQGQLSDVSSDSIPLMLLALLAASLHRLRSFLLRLFSSLGISFVTHYRSLDDSSLAHHLSLNRLFSYPHRPSSSDSSDCVVCLCCLQDGEQVRKLECRHVFHKNCFDGWLHHLNFNCPLCRSPLAPDGSVSLAERRLGGDLIAWFSLH